MLTQSLDWPPLRKSGGILFYLCLSVRPTVHPSVRRPSHNYFRCIFFMNYITRISERFIEVSYIVWCFFKLITHYMTAKLKTFVTFFSGTTIPWFLIFNFKVYISQLYCVMLFQIHNSKTFYLPKSLGRVSSVARAINACCWFT